MLMNVLPYGQSKGRLEEERGGTWDIWELEKIF